MFYRAYVVLIKFCFEQMLFRRMGMGGPNSHGSSRQLETSKLLLQVHLVLEGQGRGLGYYHSFASSELVKKRLVQVRLLLSLILYLPLLLLLLDIHEFGVFVLDIIRVWSWKVKGRYELVHGVWVCCLHTQD